MKGDARIIQILNDALTMELTSINQYFLASKVFANWGFHRLAKHLHHESIEEMRHADKLVERILFLEGHPNLQKLDRVRTGETVVEQFRADLELEQGAVARYNEGIRAATEVGDNGTRELLESILVDSEKHVDWVETQFELVRQIGESNYLAQQLHA